MTIELKVCLWRKILWKKMISRVVAQSLDNKEKFDDLKNNNNKDYDRISTVTSSDSRSKLTISPISKNIFNKTVKYFGDWNVTTCVLLVLLGAHIVAGQSDIIAPTTPVVVSLETDEVKDLCDAQCDAWCLTVQDEVCDAICNTGQRWNRTTDCSWMVNCQQSGCTGSCSTLANVNQTGYVPLKPDVSVSRDKWTGVITVSWPKYDMSSDEKIVYLVSQKTGDCKWAKLGWVYMGNTYEVPSVDLCTTPIFRVAAVSRFGSRWFSEDVKTPDLELPEPPGNLTVEIFYEKSNKANEENDEINYILQWYSSENWPKDAVKYEVSFEPNCVSLKEQDVVYIYPDMQASSEDGSYHNATGRIPIRAIGCNIIFEVAAIRSCLSDAQMANSVERSKRTPRTSVASVSVDIDCARLDGYDGEICNQPPALADPGPVRNITLIVTPIPNGNDGQIRAKVFWMPPEERPGAAEVEKYVIFYGNVKLQSEGLIPFYDEILAKKEVFVDEETETYENSVDLDIKSFGPYQTLGVTIHAARPGQSVDQPYSEIIKSQVQVNSDYSITPGDILKQSDDLYIIQVKDGNSSKVKVDVFWDRPDLETYLQMDGYEVTLTKRNLGERTGDEDATRTLTANEG